MAIVSGVNLESLKDSELVELRNAIDSLLEKRADGKVRMTHNEFQEYMKANANKLYTHKDYTMADYNRDCDSVEVIPYDLERFGLLFSEEQLRLVNGYFTGERENSRGHKLLEGHVLRDGAEFTLMDRLGVDVVVDKGYSGFGINGDNRVLFEFCEGDIYLILCENMEEYCEELRAHCEFYMVPDRLADILPKVKEAEIEVYFDGVLVDTVDVPFEKAGEMVMSLAQYGYADYNQDVKEDWERISPNKNPVLSFRVVERPLQSTVEQILDNAEMRAETKGGCDKAAEVLVL